MWVEVVSCTEISRFVVYDRHKTAHRCGIVFHLNLKLPDDLFNYGNLYEMVSQSESIGVHP